ncbi:MAG: hypothetical protein OIF50_13185, partial [Flavobacteriaceae bacterium]|nr:hypothetical protein [Flavobacteriaceae bacterium]
MGTIIKIAKTMVTTAERITITATNGNIEFNAAKNVILSSKDKIIFGEFAEQPEGANTVKIVDGYWSSDSEGNKKITRANLGDTVYFNIKSTIYALGINAILYLHEHDNFGKDQPIKSGKRTLKKNVLLSRLPKGYTTYVNSVKVELSPSWSPWIDKDP